MRMNGKFIPWSCVVCVIIAIQSLISDSLLYQYYYLINVQSIDLKNFYSENLSLSFEGLNLVIFFILSYPLTFYLYHLLITFYCMSSLSYSVCSRTDYSRPMQTDRVRKKASQLKKNYTKSC